MAKKILLADDSITIQKVISITFASENYELIIVGDGESALKRAKEARPDLIMADVAMPGKNGYEVCEAVKKDPELSGTPVLLLAGTFEPLDRPEAERVGADDSIVKPFESQQLLNKVAALLARAPERTGEPSVEPGSTRPQEGKSAPSDSEEEWGNGDFTGFPEELEEKPAFKGADQLPDLDFLDNGGVFEEPEKDLAIEEDFTDLDFNETKDLEEPVAGPAHEDVRAPEEPSKPFWAENVARDDNFSASRDISEFPDLYDEGHEEPVAKKPEPQSAPAPEPTPEPEEESFEKSFEDVETSFGGMVEESDEAEEPTVEAVEPPVQRPSFDTPSRGMDYSAQEAATAEPAAQYDEPIEAPEVFEPPAPTFVAPAMERAEEAVAEKAAERLQAIDVPREELEDAVRKAVREVVQEIAWEVVPELAEELIKAEIDKVKEVLSRLK